MGSDVICRSRKVSWRRVPEDIGWALGTSAADSICVIKCHWSVNGDPAAISTTYLTRDLAGKVAEVADQPTLTAADLLFNPLADSAAGRASTSPIGLPVAMHLELQPPQSSVARGLRLSAGHAAAMVTVRFDDPSAGRPVALTVAALRPDLFRIVIDSPAEASPLRSVATADAFDESPNNAIP
jgi:hypothetical protein